MSANLVLHYALIEVEVICMAPVEECEHDMFVEMDWDDEGLAVRLSQLEVIDADDETREVVEDWLYWSKKCYQFRVTGPI